jgi:hypothetical protein
MRKFSSLIISLVIIGPVWADVNKIERTECEAAIKGKALTDSAIHACQVWTSGLVQISDLTQEESNNAAMVAWVLAQHGLKTENRTAAIESFQRSWQFAKKGGAPQVIELIGNDYSAFLNQLGNFDQSISIIEASLKSSQQLRPQLLKHPMGFSLMLSYATALRSTKRYAQASQLLEILNDHLVKTDQNHGILSVVLNDLAICTEKLGDDKRAGGLYQRAFDLSKKYPTMYSSQIEKNHTSYLEEKNNSKNATGLTRLVEHGIRLPEQQLN